MRSLRSLLENYLDAVDALEPAVLGGKSKKAINGEKYTLRLEKESAKLVKRLSTGSTFNNRLIISITILHFLIFLLAASLVLYYRDSPKAITTVLGGSLISLLALTRSLAGLWRDKNAMDILRAIVPDLPPEQVVPVIQSLYFKSPIATSRLRQKITGSQI